jgi:hypothetical protein
MQGCKAARLALSADFPDKEGPDKEGPYQDVHLICISVNALALQTIK